MSKLTVRANTMFYICLRSLRNGALQFVSKYQDKAKAQSVADLANYGRNSLGPIESRYVVITAV
jgi:hypothetical protein